MIFRLALLGFGTFAVGTGSYVYLGLLSGLAADLRVDVKTAGQLAAVFAASYAVGSPFLVTLAVRFAPHRLLTLSMVLAAILLFLSALSPNFETLVLLRVGAALASGFYTPSAVAVGVGLAPPHRRGIAIAAVMGGLTLSFLIGIPAGSFLGGYYGWRATFALAAAFATLAAVGLLFLGPVERLPKVSAPLRSVLGSAPVRADLAVTLLGFMGTFAVVAFIGPLLETYGQLEARGIAGMQLVIGLGGVIGTVAGGFAADRPDSARYIVRVLVLASATLLSMSFLGPLSLISTTLTLVLGGVALFFGSGAVFALVPLQQHRLIHHAPEQKNLALSLNQSAIFLGQGFGAMAGGLVMAFFAPSATGVVGGLLILVSIFFAKRSHQL